MPFPTVVVTIGVPPPEKGAHQKPETGVDPLVTFSIAGDPETAKYKQCEQSDRSGGAFRSRDDTSNPPSRPDEAHRSDIKQFLQIHDVRHHRRFFRARPKSGKSRVALRVGPRLGV